ncbi:MAG: DnaA/Hda family protein [Deferribacterales bacterium]
MGTETTYNIIQVRNLIKSLYQDICENEGRYETFTNKTRAFLANCSIEVINRSSRNEIDNVLIEFTTSQKYIFESLKLDNTIANFINLITKEFKNKIKFNHKITLKTDVAKHERNMIFYDPSSTSISNTFDNFIVDDSNRRAFNIASEIANTDFKQTTTKGVIGIYGDRGLGKSHLQESIINHLMDKNQSYQIYYFKKNLWENFFKKVASNRNYSETIDKLSDADLVMFDDLSIFLSTTTMFFLIALYDLMDLRISKKKITLYSMHDNPENLSFVFEHERCTKKDFDRIFDYQAIDETRIKAKLKKEFESRLCNRIIPVDYPSPEAKMKFIKRVLLETGYIDVANLNKEEINMLELAVTKLPDDFRKLEGKAHDLADEITDKGTFVGINSFCQELTGISFINKFNNNTMSVIISRMEKFCKELNLSFEDVFGNKPQNETITFIKRAIIYALTIDNEYSQVDIGNAAGLSKSYVSKIKKNFITEYDSQIQSNKDYETVYKQIIKTSKGMI